MKRVEKLERIKPLVIQKKKVAAYARISMETDRLNHSLSAQISHYNQLIQANPEWEFAGIYADKGITGTSIKKRSEFQRLLEDCRLGKIDIVLTKSIQRFARNTVDLLEVVRELKVLGIEVRFEKENIQSLSSDGELMLTILASFAQEESRNISENVKWGTIKRFKEGIPNGKFSIYGYKWEDERLVIVTEEAKIIQRIYAEYLSGKSCLQIARMLDKDGIRTRRDNPWTDSNLRVILKNIHYTGNLLFQKEYTVDPISKKTRKNRGELPQYFVEDTHEAIISMDDFRKVETEMERRRQAGAFGNPAINTTILTSKIRCPHCDKSFHKKYRSLKSGRIMTWSCANRKAGKPATCQTGEVYDSIIKQIICEVLGIESFNEEIVEEQLDYVDVIKKEAFIIHLKNGRVETIPYRTVNRKDFYTPEVRQKLSQQRKDKHQYKRIKVATPFTGLISCGKCGETFTSSSYILKNGESGKRLFCRATGKAGHNKSIRQRTLESIICDVLNLEVFDEHLMDKQVERIFIADNKVTVVLKDGRCEIRSYLDKRPYVKWSKERREKYEQRPNTWTAERRQKMSEKMKKIRSEKKWGRK